MNTPIKPSPAHQLAEHISNDMLRANLPPESLFSSVTELQNNYNVGRPVLKQAIRILEQRGAATLRRGAGGGLITLATNPLFAARALSILIESETEDLQFMNVLSTAVNHAVFFNQINKLNWQSGLQLRQLAKKFNDLPDEEFLRIKAHHRLANKIRTIVPNPIVELAERTAYECAIDLIPYSVTQITDAKSSHGWQLSLQIVEALIAGDSLKLFECQRQQDAIVEKVWHDRARHSEVNDKLPPIGDKRRPEFQTSKNQADRLVREILREIRQLGWITGERIASGVELMERYQTTAGVVRQATLMLQEYGVIEVEKGRSGGIYITTINRNTVVNAAQDFLTDSGYTEKDLIDFMLQLSFRSIEYLCLNDEKNLKNNARQLQGKTTAKMTLLDIAGKICGNSALNIFIEVVNPLLQHRPQGSMNDEFMKAFITLDTARARRLMIDHYA